MAKPLSLGDRDARTVARIVKVNHAGEYGAIRIYRAQLFVARLLYPTLVPMLAGILRHEIEHCARFRQAMPERHARPCRIMALWGQGGLILGALTAMLGRQGIWICTAAVEETVHRHLTEQRAFLAARDPALHALIAEIERQELDHLDCARRNLRPRTSVGRSLAIVIAGATEAVIWLSTWGDSRRLARAMQHGATT